MSIYEKVETIKASTADPLTLEEVKDHLRIEKGETAEDDFLQLLIKTATQHVEEITGRALMRQKRAAYFNDWSTGDCFKLPYPPLISVSSSTSISGSSGAAVCYKDSNGDWNSFSSTGWLTDIISEPGRLCLEYEEDWPSEILHNVNPVKIHFTCGYSTSSTGIPSRFRTAMKYMIARWYENREDIVMSYSGGNVIEILGTAKTLLANDRVWEF